MKQTKNRRKPKKQRPRIHVELYTYVIYMRTVRHYKDKYKIGRFDMILYVTVIQQVTNEFTIPFLPSVTIQSTYRNVGRKMPRNVKLFIKHDNRPNPIQKMLKHIHHTSILQSSTNTRAF